MGRFKKFIILALAGVMSVGVLAGCGDNKTEPKTEVESQSSESQSNEDQGPKPGEKVKVGLIALAFGTQSFNDDILAGIELAQGTLDVEPMPLEVLEISDVANSLRTLIGQGAEFLIVATSEFKDGMLEVAEEFPDVSFLYLSETLEGYDNIMSISYKENEGAFLVGALAGLMTKTDKVGAVMALGEPTQYRYQYGYMAGVQAVNPDAEVFTAFTNSYTDVGKGNEVANVMYSKGADFVGTYAGACNLGVFQAATNAGEGRYAFGAANGQFDNMPDKILASVVKPIDKAVYGILEDYINGYFDTSSVKDLGVKENGVTMLYTTNEDLLKIIPADVQATMQELLGEVMSGDLDVPGTEEELKNFNYSHTK